MDLGKPTGLSPRLRGNRFPALSSASRMRSIPAPAGEPPTGKLSAEHYQGLSPRLRGNQTAAKSAMPSAGSIPAPAGEPTVKPAHRCSGRVYPRACGGTGDVLLYQLSLNGLSPRLRGNRGGVQEAEQPRRSIPAPAGEPLPSAGSPSRRSVYPRACGGTLTGPRPNLDIVGLSPRLRGNPARHHPGRQVEGSIPAPAGEPRECNQCSSLSGVYPRACGGTPRPPARPRPGSGLSPRLRGNPALLLLEKELEGSIPAPAGEPGSWEHLAT